jgi:hypothetical protein
MSWFWVQQGVWNSSKEEGGKMRCCRVELRWGAKLLRFKNELVGEKREIRAKQDWYPEREGGGRIWREERSY